MKNNVSEMERFVFLPIVCLLMTINALPVGAQTNGIPFEHLTSIQGLSHNTINCMVQDREGFMWFGTEAGLNRYDGYAFQVYDHNRTIPSSLSNNKIWSLWEDHTGVLWIGT